LPPKPSCVTSTLVRPMRRLAGSATGYQQV
jgi:hypothetical protein